MENFVKEKTLEYQHHLDILTSLERIIKQHQEIQTKKNIPKKYQPNTLETNDTFLTTKFNDQYEKLFYKHLKDVVNSNNTTLERHKETLKRIIYETEQYLSSLSDSPEHITRLYKTFLTDNGIKNHTPLPELQTRMNTTSQKTRSQRRHQHRKRKQDEHPQSIKKIKMEHFLSIGHMPTHPPT